jgi:signal transduction histidine kinase
MPPHIATAVLAAIERACATGEVVQHEHQLDLEGMHDLEVRVSRVSAEVALVVVRDFTERRSPDDLRHRVVEPIMRAQEQERRRLARELHDTLAQSITSLLVGLRSLEDHVQAGGRPLLDNLRKLAGDTLGEAQRLARGLRPSVLDDAGFVPAITRLIADMQRDHRWQVDVHITGFDGQPRLAPTLETALYRILQEALTNVARHARATQVDVLVDRRPNFVRAVVEDNGRGFAPEAARPDGGGLGLMGIRERAALLYGRVGIDSAPDLGTTVTVTLPS